MTFHSLRFDRAASTYDAHAQVQAAMAGTLIDLLPRNPGDGGTGAILEMGCGTGLLTRRIRERFPEAPITATDAAPRMLETARDASALVETGRSAPGEAGRSASGGAGRSIPGAEIRWQRFDASGEAPVPPAISASAPFRIAASSALVQWFPRLDRHFAMVASLLEREGAYLVSGFTRDNFPELNAILSEPPFAYPDYPGHVAAGIRAAAASAGFGIDAYREDSLETVLSTPQAFLESIRGLGSARRPESEKPLTRDRLRLLLATYQKRYSCPGGVKATWRPWYALLRKTGLPGAA
jgi:malonyl-CoA O-methyltransferase